MRKSCGLRDQGGIDRAKRPLGRYEGSGSLFEFDDAVVPHDARTSYDDVWMGIWADLVASNRSQPLLHVIECDPGAQDVLINAHLWKMFMLCSKIVNIYFLLLSIAKMSTFILTEQFLFSEPSIGVTN